MAVQSSKCKLVCKQRIISAVVLTEYILTNQYSLPEIVLKKQ